MSEIQIGGQSIPALHVGIALPVLAGLYLGYSAFIPEGESLMARNDALAAKEAALEQKRHDAEDLRRRTKEVDQVKKDIEDLGRQITLLKQKIPTDAQVPILLYDLERMAKGSQTKLKSFTPGDMRAFSGGLAPAAPPPGAPADGSAPQPAAMTSDIQELPVTIQATATYPEVIRLLQQLNAYERKLSVSNLSLTPAGGPTVTKSDVAGKTQAVFKNSLNVEFTLLAYILKQGGAPQ